MNILILTTGHGRNKFAKQMCREAYQLGHKGYTYFCTSIDKAFKNHPEWNPQNLIIHARAANPVANWMTQLSLLEHQGYKVVNRTPVLKLTSDKWESVRNLSNDGCIPPTFLYDCKDKTYVDIFGTFLGVDELQDMIHTPQVILKPRISQGQGKYVTKIDKRDLTTFDYSTIPGRFVLVQQVIPYTAIIRVFCFDGCAANKVTVDRPTPDDWKVSVCLNRGQVAANLEDFKQEVAFAEWIQNRIDGNINFIDVFRTADGPVLSEVNTACNLTIHSGLTDYNFARMIVQDLLGQKVDNVL